MVGNSPPLLPVLLWLRPYTIKPLSIFCFEYIASRSHLWLLKGSLYYPLANGHPIPYIISHPSSTFPFTSSADSSKAYESLCDALLACGLHFLIYRRFFHLE